MTNEEHPTEDHLEQYAMGRLAEGDEALFEEHMLVCENCRVKLERIDEFIRAFRAVHAQKTMAAQTERNPWFSRLSLTHPMPLAAALGAACLALVLLVPRRDGGEVQPVSLVATRTAGDRTAAIRPGKAELKLDVTALPAGARFRVQIADARGTQLWSRVLSSTSNQLLVKPDLAFRSGNHWVRVYALDSGSLVSEFGLRVR
jgi:anti-sigma factor RsiW